MREPARRRISIRTRVIAALAALLAIGLVATDVVTYLSLQDFLSDRLDAQLASARAPIEKYLGDLRQTACPSYQALSNIAQPSVYILIFHLSVGSRAGRSRAGSCPPDSYRSVLTFASGSTDNPDPAPLLPATIHYSHKVKGHVYDPRIADANLSSFEIGAKGDPGFRYRIQAVPLPGGASLVAAAPLAPMENTLSNLFRIEVGVSLAALGILVVVAMWTVRLGLRPLEDMARQADAIARGDLSRRVQPTDAVTEVGRLGAALNSMLTQIETAFSEKDASEARLRKFATDVSHELRTPLTSIRGYAELFRRGARARPDDLERAMSRIESEAARMTGLVDDLMLLARIDQGRELERHEVNLVEVASDAVADAAVVDPEREVSFDAAGDVIVVGDEHRLRQLVANLVTNALVHTPSDVQVKVTVARDDGVARIDVWDAGPPIPPERLPHLFERFRSWAPPTVGAGTADGNGTGGDGRPATGGTGLGLSIVRAIAQAHGGRAWATSTAEEGTTFHVELDATR